MSQLHQNKQQPSPVLHVSNLPLNLSLSDIVLSLESIQQSKQHTTAQLQSIHQHRAKLINNIESQISKLPSHVSIISQYTSNLLSIIDLSSESTSSISNKIKELEIQSNTVKSVLNRVSTMIELRDTITLVEHAINDKNLSKASELIYKAVYVQLYPYAYSQQHHEHQLSGTIQRQSSQVMENNVTYQLLKNLEHQLYEAIQADLAILDNENKINEELHSTLLLGYINHQYDGCVMYCNLVVKQYNQYITSNGLLIESQPPNSVIPYIDILSSYYDSIAQHIRQHLSPINRYFGVGTQIRLIQLLQEQIDKHAVDLLKRYIIDRGISTIIKQIRAVQLRRGKHSRVSTNATTTDTPVNDQTDANQLDVLLEELTFIVHESEMYDTNIRKLAKNAVIQLNTAIDTDKQLQQQIIQQGYADKDIFAARVIILGNASIIYQQLQRDEYGLELKHITKLNEHTQQLISDYITLEEQYMMQNIQKAIQIDEHVTDNKPKQSSIIDDDSTTNQSSPNKLRNDSSRQQIRGLAAVAGSMANVAAGTLASTLQAQGVQLTGANTQQSVLAQILLTGIGLYTPSITSTNTPLIVVYAHSI